MPNTNPYNANQYNPDPRQSLFLGYYLDPESETFSNALQSALKAGYSQEYSENITSKMPNWLAEKVGDSLLISLAEKNLLTFLQGEDDKIKSDITKFVLSRLNKKKYSERTEMTGADGKDLQPVLVKFIGDEDNNNTN